MLSKLLEDNYKEILIAAKNITRRRGHEADELINETYIELSKKDIREQCFVKYFTKAMKYQYGHPRKAFRKAVETKSDPLDFDISSDDWKEIEVNIDMEKVSEETCDLIRELSHLTVDRAMKYVDVMEKKEGMLPHEKEIFDLHFNKGKSSRDIAREVEEETGYKMSHMRYNEMIRNVKNKLNGRS